MKETNKDIEGILIKCVLLPFIFLSALFILCTKTSLNNSEKEYSTKEIVTYEAFVTRSSVLSYLGENCSKWAFGDEVYNSKMIDLTYRWNDRHEDLFKLNPGSPVVKSSERIKNACIEWGIK